LSGKFDITYVYSYSLLSLIFSIFQLHGPVITFF